MERNWEMGKRGRESERERVFFFLFSLSFYSIKKVNESDEGSERSERKKMLSLKWSRYVWKYFHVILMNLRWKIVEGIKKKIFFFSNFNLKESFRLIRFVNNNHQLSSMSIINIYLLWLEDEDRRRNGRWIITNENDWLLA